jgi:hypothetical protein
LSFSQNLSKIYRIRPPSSGNPFKINKNMIMDEVVMDEVGLAGQGGFGSTGPPVRGIKRAADGLLNNAQAAKRRKGEPLLLFVERSSTIESCCQPPPPIWK